MNKWLIGLVVALLGTALAATEVEAKRLGAGRSIGAQRSVAPAQSAKPPAQQAQQTSAATPAQQPAAAPAGSKWAPILGGLALGGLLGYLFSGSGLGGVLLLALLAIGAVMLVRMLARQRPGAPQPMQYAGLGNETVAAPPPSQAAGFDAAPAPAADLPAGFDLNGFLRAAKLSFVKLQLANDTGDLEQIREFTTPGMFDALAQDVTGRGAERQHTDVVTLNADLLEVATEADTHHASVRFSGMVRETPGAGPVGFEEVWNLVKPLDGASGWLLAGIQQMH